MFTPSLFKKIFNTIRTSLNGEQRDYTQGNISKAIFLLAIPMILELSLESVFAVVDIFFVSKLGPQAIATVGLTESVISLVYSIAIGLSTAATAVVARRIGEKNPEGASHAGAQSLIVAFIATAVISVLGVFFAGNILHLMGADPAVVKEGAVFTRIMFGSSIVIMLLFLINGIFRGAGDAAMAMKSLWLASILNIILCPLFIHFLGLKGAAIATVIGRTGGVVYQSYHLFKGKGTIRLTAAHFRYDPKLLKTIVDIGWPATLQFLIGSGSWIFLARLVAETGGTTATAGYQIALRNFVFFILPAWGLSNAAATLVGQNLGAKNPMRAEQSVYITAKYSAAFMGVVMFLFVFLPVSIMQIYTKDEEIIRFGALAMRWIGSANIFYGIGMVMMQALNGAGDTRTPTRISFFCFWLFQIPLAYTLAIGFGLKATGTLIAIPIAETMIALVAWYFFRKGKWKTVKV
ncbi:MAG: MATE family efflux transporter [Bacteroidota bacterium]|nr:MATE family efflux transporter [Bacteroidota bacterium]